MNDNPNSEARDTLFVAGGAALMIFGAGLLMAHPLIRRTILSAVSPMLPQLEGSLKTEASRILPDLERYLKLRGM